MNSAPWEETVAEDRHFDLGERLRTVRQAHGLSQRELARRSGVSHGTISLIEQNENSPSVASLKKVLDGIPMSLAEFFTLNLPTEDKIFYRPEEFLEIASGPLSLRQVGNRPGMSMQILHERYHPGADTGRAMLRHESEEGGVVVRGRVEITVGARKAVLGPGDGYYFDSRQPHRFRNIGDEDCEIVSVCTPPFF